MGWETTWKQGEARGSLSEWVSGRLPGVLEAPSWLGLGLPGKGREAAGCSWNQDEARTFQQNLLNRTQGY